ncbi:MAG TPA: hypothetical protein VET48_01170 [Steroidobacteraceae bacterium]|nr:hypothetical protein [Steroidobacteraceae bacterium]
MKHATLLFAAVASLTCGFAYAQETRAERDTQRDANQQERIEQGLKSGELTTHEAGQLERREAHVDRLEARAERDGKISNGEQARINAAQNRTSRGIYRQKHDAQVGNPNSASSQRMQADVQRNVNQQARIEQGLQSGALTNHEAGKLERGQARVDRTEANAAADGHVGPAEQARVQRKENRQSRRIFREKHD